MYISLVTLNAGKSAERQFFMRLKTSLVVQEGVMIPQNETPCLELDGDTMKSCLSILPATVRVLRCGCPSVQWLLTVVPSVGFKDRLLEAIHDVLRKLQKPGENFKIVAPTEWRIGTVITITRIVAPKIVE